MDGSRDRGEGDHILRVETTFDTEFASKYLVQLCKHWAHKHEVKYSAEEGVVCFDDVRAALFYAGRDSLRVLLCAADGPTMERLQSTVTRHLERFAFRETLVQPVWRSVE